MAVGPRICVVLAGDSNFFHQTRAAIESIRRSHQAGADIRLVQIGPFPSDQLEWLDRAGVTRFDRIDDIPKFTGAPLHAVSLTCRPFLPQMFPDVDGFVWFDSDCRVLQPAGLTPWIEQASDPTCPVAASQETEPAYCINTQPVFAGNYHRVTNARIRLVYGDEVAHFLEFYKMFNAGLFAMPAGSTVWERYRKNLNQALKFPFESMREQDALNIAIIESGVRPMPSTLNWLCSLAMPVRGPDGRWMSPNKPQRAIEIAHLTNSDLVVTQGRQRTTYYDEYRKIGLTE